VQGYMITEDYIKNVIQGSVCDENVKHILISSTGRPSLTQFIYEVFCYYMPAYEDPRLTSYPERDPYNVSEIFYSLIQKFGEGHGDAVIRITDPYDTIYNRCYPGGDVMFDSSLFDNLYANIEDNFGQDTANSCFQEIVQLLEHVIIHIELGFLYFRESRDNQVFKIFMHYNGPSIAIFVH
jgi:hypothetical protein